VSGPGNTATQTPQRLVAAAERLFAAGGEEATSLRAIAREARSNAAAVHYHFGGRDQLLRAVLDRHLGPVQERRLALVDDAQARGRPVSVPLLVEAVARPDLELLASLRRKRLPVAHFLGRSHASEGAAVAAYHREQFDGLAARLLPLLAESLPGLGAEELAVRVRWVFAIVVAQFGAAGDGAEVHTQLARVVAFGAAGLAAPPSDPPAASGTKARRPRKAGKK
jgi:AcrR family transcriptional regulator